jgi:hypothetical protein
MLKISGQSAQKLKIMWTQKFSETAVLGNSTQTFAFLCKQWHGQQNSFGQFF